MSSFNNSHAISQIETLASKKLINNRTKLELLLNTYFEQMTTGCRILSNCTNEYCYNNKNIPQRDSSEAVKQAFALARQAFADRPQYFFCPCPCLYLPDFTSDANITLSLQSFRAIRNNAINKKDFTLLKEVVRLCFLSADSINNSFFSIEAYRNGFDFTKSSGIDFEIVDNFYKELSEVEGADLNVLLTASVEALSQSFSKICKKCTSARDLRFIIILLQCPLLMEPTHHEILSRITEGILEIPLLSRERLKVLLQEVPKPIFTRMLSLFQQFITVQLYARGYIDEKIAYATRVIGILNAANEGKVFHKDRVHYDEFYNDAVNQIVDLKEDYKRWVRSLQDITNRDNFENFSFCQYPFILDPESKSQVLQFDAEVQQSRELRTAFMSSFFTQTAPSFYLVLNIYRERLLQSALNQLTVRQHELKKPLKVVFVGEEGIDAGGVQKEFFQLVVKQLFDVQYGMFEHNEDSRSFWFNPNSLENEDNFKLTGIILGLAIYNSVIVDVHFPLVVYKKLLGMTPTLEDLKEMDPDLGRGLQSLLDFDGNVEEIFCRSFEVESEAFGHVMRHELKPNGANIPVTNENRQEYVDLFVRWKLVISIQKQFDAFLNGFNLVVNNRDILHLFRPEELELMICGSPLLDFDALERATKYADGFSKDDPLMIAFWKIVKDFSEENKKRFLAFCTGSDRVPIKGLGNMQFVIVKNGDDSDRLPTAHTCFNYLLLPRYSSPEKLKDRLLTAIQNAEGFGLQ